MHTMASNHQEYRISGCTLYYQALVIVYTSDVAYEPSQPQAARPNSSVCLWKPAKGEGGSQPLCKNCLVGPAGACVSSRQVVRQEDWCVFCGARNVELAGNSAAF